MNKSMKNKSKKNIKNKDEFFNLSPKKLFIFGLVFMLIAFILLGITLIKQKSNKSEVIKITTPAEAYKQNQIIQTNQAEIKVENIKFSGGSKPFVAPEGKQYAIIDFYIKNISNQPIQVLPSSDIYAKDSNGNVSYLTPYSLSNPFNAGELPPGEQIRGQISYLIPKNEKSKLFIDSMWSSRVIAIELN